MRMRSVDVLVVGAGPSGLAAAAHLAAHGVRAEAVEREQWAGGAPRHCGHGGFGAPWLTGPDYARRAVEDAVRAGAVIGTGVTVLDWAPGPHPPMGTSRDRPRESPAVDTTGPCGPERITARAVVLATGARERPRSARLVPGTRPAGVLTTGELQQLVHRYGRSVGRRAVVVGAEPVSFHAADTLRQSGAEVVALVTDLPRAQAPRSRVMDARLRCGVPLLTGTTVTRLYGRGRLAGVGIRRADGRSATLACDTVVFTGDFVPEHELARRGGLDIDPGTRGPAVDAAFRTSRRGVFAVGNLLHAVESAGAAAREGRSAGARVAEFLTTGHWPPGTGVPVEAVPPLRWAAPHRIAPDAVYDRLTLRTAAFLPRPRLLVTQDGHRLHEERHWRTAVPNRPLRIGAHWAERVDPEGGPVRISAW
ncbi:NAD(P)/FAD-dependent oxidoreductase [Streptomyces sp. NPDC002004]